MSEVFVSKVRPIGSSLGVIIPNKVIDAQNLKPGQNVTVSIIKPNFALLDKMFGSMKGVKEPFVRDRRDRI